jgi:hypothetical protein
MSDEVLYVEFQERQPKTRKKAQSTPDRLSIEKNIPQKIEKKKKKTKKIIEGDEKGNFIYLITSPVFNAVKIGLTTNANSLQGRYTTPYGGDLEMHVYDTLGENCDTAESKIHAYFHKYNITHEIFEKRKLYSYIRYCDSRYTKIHYSECATTKSSFMSFLTDLICCF